jgi:hypothetical protein
MIIAYEVRLGVLAVSEWVIANTREYTAIPFLQYINLLIFAVKNDSQSVTFQNNNYGII